MSWFSMHCEAIDAAIALILRVGTGALLQRRDWAGAFQQICVWPGDFELIGMVFEGSYYNYANAASLRAQKFAWYF